MRQYREQFGEFYLQFRHKEGRTTVLEPFYSALRRLVQAAAVVFLKDYPTFQFVAIFYSWNAVCLLNFMFLSYKLKSDLYSEMINEFFIVVMLYCLLAFSDFTSNQRAKNFMGFSIMAVMLLNMVYNFTLIIASSIRQLIVKLKTKYYTWKRKRLLIRLVARIEKEELELEKIESINCEEANL